MSDEYIVETHQGQWGIHHCRGHLLKARLDGLQSHTPACDRLEQTELAGGAVIEDPDGVKLLAPWHTLCDRRQEVGERPRVILDGHDHRRLQRCRDQLRARNSMRASVSGCLWQ